MQHLPDEFVSSAGDGREPARPTGRTRSPQTAASIRRWLVARLSETLDVPAEEIDVDEPLVSFGLSSRAAVVLTGDLADWLCVDLAPTLVWEYPTIESLSRYLADERPVPASRSEASTRQEAADDAVAIIGLGCRFPGAPDPDSFWRLLREGRDAIVEAPAERGTLGIDFETNLAPGLACPKWGGFLADVDAFDSQFFGITPREAISLDPQQRLLLEVAWEACEHAGRAPDQLAGSRTGVFVGICTQEYAHILLGHPEHIDAYLGTGNGGSLAANRLSYVLDLRGPSLAIDTACSSSLVAVHLAVRSLRAGECDLALAGGVNLILSPALTIAFAQAGMLAPGGRCRTFDAEAEGYARGEGCGLVVLKRLADARHDGDRVLAVIRGSAVVQDGRSNGLTAPNGLAQQEVIRGALADAGTSPSEISYVEAHGTGTPLGDPIEIEALKAVLLPNRSPDRPCAVGALKTNIGHLEAAAGIAGLIKVVLALQHREIPRNLHFTRMNPRIALTETALFLPTDHLPWTTTAPRRLAGVSSFGFGGTNCHVVLEEAAPADSAGDVPEQPRPSGRPWHLLALSAQSERALRDLAERYATFLRTHPDVSLADVCFTANAGRSHFGYRLAVPTDSVAHLQAQLAAEDVGGHTSEVVHGRAAHPRPLGPVFLFTGQGSQYVGMGRGLYETQPTFRSAMDRCDALLRPYLERPLLSVIYPAPGDPLLLDETAYTQPALFALEYALTQVWESWGVRPAAVLGHSLGEYVAACVAGVFSLEDALRLIAKRGQLMQALPQTGHMAAVFAEEARAAAAVAPYRESAAIAAVNGPQHVVISGSRPAVHAIVQGLEAEGVAARPLSVSHAFHSPLMDPILDAFEDIAMQVRYSPPRVDVISNVTGRVLDDEVIASPQYWRRQLREPVRFASGMRTLSEQGYAAFVEIGPSATLSAMGKRCVPPGESLWLQSLGRGRDDWQTLLSSLGALYVRGGAIDWSGVDRGFPRRRIALPTYPFQRRSYWPSNGRASSTSGGRVAEASPPNVDHPLLGRPLRTLAHHPATRVWEVDLDRLRVRYLDDHRVRGVAVMPVAGYLEMALAAAHQTFGGGAHVVAHLGLHQPLVIPPEGSRTIQVTLAADGGADASFYVHSRVTDALETSWTLHATASVRRAGQEPALSGSGGGHRDQTASI